MSHCHNVITFSIVEKMCVICSTGRRKDTTPYAKRVESAFLVELIERVLRHICNHYLFRVNLSDGAQMLEP